MNKIKVYIKTMKEKDKLGNEEGNDKTKTTAGVSKRHNDTRRERETTIAVQDRWRHLLSPCEKYVEMTATPRRQLPERAVIRTANTTSKEKNTEEIIRWIKQAS